MRYLIPAVLVLAGCSSMPLAEVQAAKAKDLRDAGAAAAKSGDLKGAIEYYTRSIEFNPQFAEAFYRRGNLYMEMNRVRDAEVSMSSRELLERAVTDYSDAIRLNPVYYEAYFNRAMILFKYSKYRDGVADLLQCCAVRNKEAEPHLILGQIYDEKFEDRQIAALEHYEKYVELGGTDEGVKEKVRQWRDLKKSMGGGAAPTPTKAPTADDENGAMEMHKQVMALIPKDKIAAMNLLDEMLKKYPGTKYVKDRAVQFAALQKAFRPEGSPPPVPPKK